MRKVIWKIRGNKDGYKKYLELLKEDGEEIVSEEEKETRQGKIIIITLK